METYHLILLLFGTTYASANNELKIEKCTNNYCEYIPGQKESRIVINSPHGGWMLPDNIPNRTYGCLSANNTCIYTHTCTPKSKSSCKATTVKDVNTIPLATKLRDELEILTGYRPHLVLLYLNRAKFDGNRNKSVGTFGNSNTERVYDEYHGFIREARKKINGRGLFLDIHGHNRDPGWTMIGMLVTGTELLALKPSFSFETSSIRHLAEANKNTSFLDIVRGPKSFGQLLQDTGIDSVPSVTNPDPKNYKYYFGGENTRVYGSKDSGMIDAIQIETHSKYRKLDMIPDYAKKVAKVINKYMDEYYPITPPLSSACCLNPSLIIYFLFLWSFFSIVNSVSE